MQTLCRCTPVLASATSLIWLPCSEPATAPEVYCSLLYSLQDQSRSPYSLQDQVKVSSEGNKPWHQVANRFKDSAVWLQVAFVPNTHYAFTVGKDGAVKYWDADRWELLLTLEAHKAEVSFLG
jgi:WD40 repeat protein